MVFLIMEAVTEYPSERMLPMQ